METHKKIPCILLVDDDEVTNFLNRRLIEHYQLADHIEVRLNGKEALKFLTDKNTTEENLRPNLILLDINMPVMDGWEFMQAYTREVLDEKNKTNIVMLSTSSNPDDIDRAASLPLIKGFISKPLSIQLLQEILPNCF